MYEFKYPHPQLLKEKKNSNFILIYFSNAPSNWTANTTTYKCNMLDRGTYIPSFKNVIILPNNCHHKNGLKYPNHFPT